MLITNHGNLPIYSAGCFLLGGFIYSMTVHPEKTAMLASTPYGNYVIQSDFKLTNGQVGKLLSINNSQSSFIDDQKKAFSYIERIKHILFYNLQLTNKDILVLGAGGFTLSAENTFGNRFTYVDIDPAIYGIVKKNFLKNINGIFITADARYYVKEHQNSYDVIISDTYSNNFTIPSHLLTREYFESIKHALRPNGIAVFNIIASPLLNTPYAKRVDNTLRAVFESCTANPMWSNQNSSENIIYICQNNDESNDSTVYSDDLSQASLDALIQMQ
jgi:spermidine synthase